MRGNASQGTSSLVRPNDNDNVLTVLGDSGAMANIAAQRIKREFKEVIKSEEVSERSANVRGASGVESTVARVSRVLVSPESILILAISYSGRVSRYYAIPAIGMRDLDSSARSSTNPLDRRKVTGADRRACCASRNPVLDCRSYAYLLSFVYSFRIFGEKAQRVSVNIELYHSRVAT